MGPKKKNEPEPVPEPEPDCKMAKMVVKYTPKSSNPEFELEPIEIVVNVNTNCRSDIVIDFIKRVLTKKIAEKISDLGGSKENENQLVFDDFKSNDEGNTENKDEQTEQLETKEQAIEKLIEHLKSFQKLVMEKSLEDFSFKKLEPPLPDGTPSTADPVVIKADTKVKLMTNASSIFKAMSTYLVGVRETVRPGDVGEQEPTPKIIYLSTSKT